MLNINDIKEIENIINKKDYDVWKKEFVDGYEYGEYIADYRCFGMWSHGAVSPLHKFYGDEKYFEYLAKVIQNICFEFNIDLYHIVKNHVPTEEEAKENALKEKDYELWKKEFVVGYKEKEEIPTYRLIDSIMKEGYVSIEKRPLHELLVTRRTNVNFYIGDKILSALVDKFALS